MAERDPPIPPPIIHPPSYHQNRTISYRNFFAYPQNFKSYTPGRGMTKIVTDLLPITLGVDHQQLGGMSYPHPHTPILVAYPLFHTRKRFSYPYTIPPFPPNTKKKSFITPLGHTPTIIPCVIPPLSPPPPTP